MPADPDKFELVLVGHIPETTLLGSRVVEKRA